MVMKGSSAFSCRFCAADFFQRFFAPTKDDNEEPQEAPPVQSLQEQQQLRALQARVRKWVSLAHPRAKEYFAPHEKLEEILTLLARNIEPYQFINDEGECDRCMLWHGDITRQGELIPADDPVAASDVANWLKDGEDVEAVVKFAMPGDAEHRVTYAVRLMAFIFETDDLVLALQKLPRAPCKMRCSQRLCVNPKHVHLGHCE